MAWLSLNSWAKINQIITSFVIKTKISKIQKKSYWIVRKKDTKKKKNEWKKFKDNTTNTVGKQQCKNYYTIEDKLLLFKIIVSQIW